MRIKYAGLRFPPPLLEDDGLVLVNDMFVRAVVCMRYVDDVRKCRLCRQCLAAKIRSQVELGDCVNAILSQGREWED